MLHTKRRIIGFIWTRIPETPTKSYVGKNTLNSQMERPQNRNMCSAQIRVVAIRLLNQQTRWNERCFDSETSHINRRQLTVSSVCIEMFVVHTSPCHRLVELNTCYRRNSALWTTLWVARGRIQRTLPHEYWILTCMFTELCFKGGL